jgi:ATP-dependent Lon protease
MVQSHLWKDDAWRKRLVGVVPTTETEEEGRTMVKYHSLGTAATVKQISKLSLPHVEFRLFLIGYCRIRIQGLVRESPFPVAMVTEVDYVDNADDRLSVEVRELTSLLRTEANSLIDLLGVPEENADRLKNLLSQLPDHSLPDLLCSVVKGSFKEKLKVLNAIDLPKRIKTALPLVTRQIETMKLLQKASSLRPLKGRPRAIRPAVPAKDGSDPNDIDDITKLEIRLKNENLPDHARKAGEKTLKQLKGMPPQFPDHALSRNHLEFLLDLPWSKSTEDHIDIVKARADLDSDHYGMKELKRRVLEFLAVRQIKKDSKGPILCFVGAPGVGKTSIGRSIAHSMGRKFHRIALGGVCDQSEIRGHRRTYVGSMAGRILQGLHNIGVNNPVFLLDEVDKLNRGVQGDPLAALLEVLDPEQNHSFVDHYLGIPFDLSKVLFIATANTMATIPPPLLDRMEVITTPGYTKEEKLEIAKRHLLPKQLEHHGLTADHLQFNDASLKLIISGYTREAGVRNLERKIGAICRGAAVKVVENKDNNSLSQPSSTPATSLSLPIAVTSQFVFEVLGPARYEQEDSAGTSRVGVAVGLAWTAVGGEIMYVEAAKMPGEGKLVLTGQLGDVMKESAQIGLNWLRSNASKYGIVCGSLDKTDIHIHFPAGAISKDGPSAGVTIVTVLASLFSGKHVRANLAMTGEVTLRGAVLPVGGIKEKVLAAHRSGITHVMLPTKNEKDLYEISQAVKDDMEFTFVSEVEEVLCTAFEELIPAPPVATVASKL